MPSISLAEIYVSPFTQALIWLGSLLVVGAMLYFGNRYLGTMKTIFLMFELALTIVWFWATDWQLSILHASTSDGGTVIGMLVFLAFGIGTGWMLCNEAMTTARNQFGLELNLFRRFHIMERLAARMGPVEPHEAPFDLPQE